MRHRLNFQAALAAFFFALVPAGSLAQNPGAVTNHAFVIGKGAGTTGYTSLLCGSAQLAIGQAAADPICRSITGDVTLSAAGAITLATVNSNVGSFGSTTQCVSFTVNAKGLITAASAATCAPAVGSITGLGTGVATALGVNIGSAGAFITFNGALGTPSSGTLTNATGLPISTGVSGLGAGCATFLGTPSSANLRGCLTDEVGTGAAYFVGGALGTPASGTATNLTGLPISTGLTGAGTGVLTALGVNVGSAGAFVVNGGALGTPSSGTATNLTGLPANGGLTGQVPIANGGSSQGTAAGARGSSGFNVDSATGIGDSNYSILTTDRQIYHTALTAARTHTLPAANAVNAGQVFVVSDFRGLASASNTITLQRAGSDTINGVASVVAVSAQYGAGIFWSDGSSRWTYFPASSGGGSGTVTNVATGTGLTGGPITSTGTISLSTARQTLPTVQTFTSGTAATYTTPANALWIEVYACGGGGGGAGASSSANTTVAGSNGGTTSFNSIDAAGGSGASGGVNSHPRGGAGGTGGSGTATRRMAGHVGEASVIITASISPVGAYGGGSALMGGGASSVNGTTVGNAGVANTGGGGSGGSNTTQNVGGAGGGGAECFYLIINSPSASYTYTVGGGGAGGVSTTNGGAGGAGYIQVIEHYGS